MLAWRMPFISRRVLQLRMRAGKWPLRGSALGSSRALDMTRLLMIIMTLPLAFNVFCPQKMVCSQEGSVGFGVWQSLVTSFCNKLILLHAESYSYLSATNCFLMLVRSRIVETIEPWWEAADWWGRPQQRYQPWSEWLEGRVVGHQSIWLGWRAGLSASGAYG